MKHFEEREIKKDNFEKFKIFTPRIVEQTLSLIKKTKGKKIINFNSTLEGGGVAGLITNELAFENYLGYQNRGYVLKGPKKFFVITKKIHNLLQGKEGVLKKEEKNFYLDFLLKKTSTDFLKILEKENPEIVVIHDPQLLPLIKFIPSRIKSVLRLHIDLSSPNKKVLSFLKPFILSYHKIIFSHPDYVFEWLPKEKAEIIFPAINPFEEKNKPLKISLAKEILFSFGINPEKPILFQVARFDFWKDQLATLKTYYLAKNSYPELQLVLAGFFQAKDDPEAIDYLKKVKKHSQGDPDIFLFSELSQIKGTSNDLFINALNTAGTVFIHKSIREGFGLAITEAMWKKKPVIAGRTKGIELQIEDKKTGFLVDNALEASFWLKKLLGDKRLRKKIGQAGHQRIKEKFLFSRLIFDKVNLYLNLFH